MTESDKPRKNYVCTYKPLQIFPSDGYLAVFCYKDEGYALVARKPDYLALAEMREIVTEVFPDYRYREISNKVITNKIVAMDLYDGDFQVCDECHNFAGIIKEGDDPASVSHLLPEEYREAIGNRPDPKGTT